MGSGDQPGGTSAAADREAWLASLVDRVERELGEATVGVVASDARAGRVIAANRALFDILGLDRSQGLPDFDQLRAAVDPEAHGEVAVSVSELPPGRPGVLSREQNLRTPGGRRRRVRVTITTLYRAGDPDPVVLSYVTTREQPPARWTPIPAADGERVLAITDASWRILAMGPGVARWGRDPGAMIGTDGLLYFHPDDLPRLVAVADRLLSGQLDEAHVSFRSRRQAGPGWRPMESIVRRVTGPGGQRALAWLFTEAADSGDGEPTASGPALLAWLRSRPELRRSWPAAVTEGIRELSPRQREVLVAVVEGWRVPTIARHMGVAPSTVRNHLAAVFAKLGVSSQAELLETLGAG